MNINIYLEDNVAKQLSQFAKKERRKKNSIIREAVKDWLSKHTEHKWPSSILEFNGIKDFPDIKELRKNLSDPQKKLF